MRHPQSIGITQLSYKLPKSRLSVEELETAGRIISPAELLDDFGFEYCYLHESDGAFDDLIIKSGKQTLEKANIPHEGIEFLFLYSGINRFSPEIASVEKEPLGLFSYAVARAHHELNLTGANAIAISQQGCGGLLSTIDMAARLLGSSDKRAALCLAGDALPSGANREIMYNVMSDAAAAVLIEKGTERNRIVRFYQQTQSYYWDTPRHREELLAAYFPMAQRVIETCLDRADLKVDEVRWFVPHNVSLRSWRILAQQLSVPEEKVWTKNIRRVGHTVSTDHIINLVDMEKEGVLNSGDFLVLFTFGFGANWSCLILQH